MRCLGRALGWRGWWLRRQGGVVGVEPFWLLGCEVCVFVVDVSEETAFLSTGVSNILVL